MSRVTCVIWTTVVVTIVLAWSADAVPRSQFVPFTSHTRLSRISAAASPTIRIPPKFPFFNETYSYISVSDALHIYVNSIFFDIWNYFLQVSSNGYLSFSSRSAFGTPVRFPFKHTLASLICPFWANVDPSGIGQVYYRYASGSTAINNEIRKYFSSAAGFRATWVLIATWYNVGYFDRHTDKVRCSYELDLSRHA